MRALKTFLISAVIYLFCINNYATAGTWQTLQVPGAIGDSMATGVDGGKIVGWAMDSAYNSHGFIYNGSSYVSLNVPNSPWTQPMGISGSKIVGASGYGGFLYNGTSFQILNIPGSPYWGKSANDIDGSNIVGYYSDNSGVRHGFLYNGLTYATIDPPGSQDTFLSGISGNNIVGTCSHNGGQSGFVYNISTKVTTYLDSMGFISADCIDGDNIIGRVWGPHNVLYNLKTDAWSYVDMPGVYDSIPLSISGDTVVGRYTVYDGSSYSLHPFVYTIPEPATLLLLGLGAAMLRKKAMD